MRRGDLAAFRVVALDIPIAEITRQYMGYIELLDEMQFELAAEYLVMAAILAEIKSRMLLPRPSEDEDEEDPRAELVRRLQEYERFKQAAEDIDDLPREGRDWMVGGAHMPDRKIIQIPPEVDLDDMLAALRDVLGRAELFSSHQVQMEPLSVRERMTSSALITVRAGESVSVPVFTRQTSEALVTPGLK